MARKAETGVSRSAETDFTTGTSVASRASRENCLKSGCSIALVPRPPGIRALCRVSGPCRDTRRGFIIGETAGADVVCGALGPVEKPAVTFMLGTLVTLLGLRSRLELEGL